MPQHSIRVNGSDALKSICDAKHMSQRALIQTMIDAYLASEDVRKAVGAWHAEVLPLDPQAPQ